MIILSDIIDFCRAEALSGKFYPSEASDWRWFCREYSKAFHTPLYQVELMEPEHVILSVLEDGLDLKRIRKEQDLKSLIEELRRLEDPNYDNTQEKEMEDWTSGIEDWEDQRVAAGAPIPKRGAQPEFEKDSEKQFPKEGGINLSYMSKEEEGDPDNGFDE